MIDLTPLEVRKKKGDFRRQLRGYDPGQVDDFLDVVADRLEQLVRESIPTAERLVRLEQQVTEFRDRERAMTEALVTAQQMRDQMQTQVAKEVELAKRQAVQDADRIRSDATQDVEREEENLARLRQRQRQLLQNFRTFLERELSELVVFSKGLDFDESVPDGEAPVRGRRSSGRSRASGRSVGAPPADEVGEDEHGTPPQPLRPSAPERTPQPEPRPYQPPRADAAFAAAAPLAAPMVPPLAAPMEPPLDRFGGIQSEEVPPASQPAADNPAGVRPEASGHFPREAGAAGAFVAEPPPAVEDRPEPVEAALRTSAPEPREALSDVSEDEIGGLFTGWVDAPPAEPDGMEDLPSLGPEADLEAPVSDEAFLDELLLSEAELLLSDEDVLEDPLDDELDDFALEEIGGDPDAADFALEEELLAEEVVAAESAPGDQPVNLDVLSDADEFANINIDDLGLPPLPRALDRDAFGSSGLTLRPLPADEEAPEVPRERGRDDDEDMFSSLFGKPR